jgi:7 transmembrane receptor (rhodopsin family)
MTDVEKVDSLVVTILLVCELIMFVTCVFGNAVVCSVMIFKEKFKNSSSMYILSMSVADLLVGLIAIPTGGLQALNHRPHNFAACTSLLLSIVVISGASISSVFALTIGRFWAICFPFSYNNLDTFRLNGIIITISWIFPLFLIVPVLFDDGIRDRFDGKCRMSTILGSRTMWVHSSLFLLYIAVMIVLHCIMYRTLSVQVSTGKLEPTTFCLIFDFISSVKIFVHRSVSSFELISPLPKHSR